ncbi:hypothetical protein [Enterococcus sp. HY326]|uniref:hypothetical protein n=1 Tax=Enterococcus sp. HY326 TaxID=2971265 RepID=UPI00224031A4|nr:hypothetical protein [Enterococcus sp. HY326]
MQLLWKNLEDQNLRVKIRQNPENFVGHDGQTALQKMILGALDCLVTIASDLSRCHLLLAINNHELTATLRLPEEQSLEPWLNSQNIIDFSELLVLKNLSSYFTIDVQNQQQFISQTYHDGLLKEKQQALFEGDFKKVSLRFIPDFKGFDSQPLPYGVFYNFCHQLAFLNDGLIVELKENQMQKNYFLFRQGLVEYLYEQDEFSSRRRKPFYFEKQIQHVHVKVALSRNDQGRIAASFANNLQTYQGGTHLEGLIDGALVALNDYFKKQKNIAVFDEEKLLTRFDLAVAVKLPNAKYFGITKLKLRNPEVHQLVEEAVADEFAIFLDRYPLWYKDK